MRLQGYKDGEIHKVGQRYQFVKDGKVKGTYDSVEELVKGQNKKKPKVLKPDENTLEVYDLDKEES